MAKNNRDLTSRPQTEGLTRLFYMDHLRASLVILVVLHHVAVVYGAFVPGFYYVEPPFTEPLAYRNLLVFATLNQSWFMGAFFLVAGYFTPGSYDRKGPVSFFRDRLLRLGVPLFFFVFVISSVTGIGFWLMPAELTGIETEFTLRSWLENYTRLFGLGPMWFVALLLIFNGGYILWRILRKKHNSSLKRKNSFPGYVGIIIATLLLAAVSYLVRFVIPIGKAFTIPFGRAGLAFPSLAYLPQYLGFFVIGIIAAGRDWLRLLPPFKGIVGGIAALIALILLLPLGFSGRWFSLEIGDALGNGLGNGHWQSAIWALFDSIFAVGLSLSALAMFRRFFNKKSKFGTFLAKHGYAVYIFHITVLIFIAYAFRGLGLTTMTKAILMSVIVVPACFVVAFLIRRIPGVSRVL